jgi:hypothetical protein
MADLDGQMGQQELHPFDLSSHGQPLMLHPVPVLAPLHPENAEKEARGKGARHLGIHVTAHGSIEKGSFSHSVHELLRSCLVW